MNFIYKVVIECFLLESNTKLYTAQSVKVFSVWHGIVKNKNAKLLIRLVLSRLH